MNNYKTKRNGYFSKNSLTAILRNEKYIGTYVFNRASSKDVDGRRNNHKSKSDDEIIRLPNAVPQIISSADFQAVQDKMSKRKQTRNSSRAIETYLLRTKIFCGICGGAYVGSRRKTRKLGHYFVGYMCNQRYRTKGAKCHNKEINRDFIEGVVLEELTEYVFSDKYIPYITEEYNVYLNERNGNYQDRIKAYQKKMKEIQKAIDKLVDMLMKTQSQTLFDRLQECEKEQQSLETHLQKLQYENKQSGVSQDQMKAVFVKIREKLLTGDLQTIKQIIDTYIQKIVVYPENVTIIFNFFPSINLAIPDTVKENACRDAHVQDEQTRQAFQKKSA